MPKEELEPFVDVGGRRRLEPGAPIAATTASRSARCGIERERLSNRLA
jgi:hypothetical protein